MRRDSAAEGEARARAECRRARALTAGTDRARVLRSKGMVASSGWAGERNAAGYGTSGQCSTLTTVMSSLTQPGSQICSVAPQQLQEDKLASKSWNVQRLVRAVHGKNVQVCPASSLLGLFDLVSSGSAAEPSIPRPPPVNGANFKRHRPLKDRIALATCTLLCTGDAWVVRQRPLPLKDEIMPPNMPAGARNLSETLPSNIVAKLLKKLNYLAYWNISLVHREDRLLRLSERDFKDLDLPPLTMHVHDFLATTRYVFMLHTSERKEVLSCKRRCLNKGQGTVFKPIVNPSHSTSLKIADRTTHHHDSDLPVTVHQPAAVTTKAQHNQMAAVHPVPGPVLGVNFDFLRRGNVFKPVDTRPSNLNNHSQQNQIRSRPTTTSSASTLAVGKGYDLQAFYNRDKG